jgi:hypothetical protein
VHAFARAVYEEGRKDGTSAIGLPSQQGTRRMRIRDWILLAAVAASASCGGSGTPGGTKTPPPSNSTLPPSSTLAAKCAAPRSGIDPTTGAAYPDQPGTAVDEKSWLRSWSDELYLWYRELPNVDPAGPQTVPAYFDLLRSTATTASGRFKDRFHFTYPTADWIALSQSGVGAGYGVQWIILANRPPRKLVAAYNQPGSPAATQNVTRGVEVLTVDGADLVNGNDAATVDKLNRGLFPSAAGETHTFYIRDPGPTGSFRTIPMVSANVQSTPVQKTQAIPTAPTVGYMLFNDHIATAEDGLIAAVNDLKTANVKDLILDIRYNGGGYLAIASEIAYMIAGPGPTAGKVFERLAFNDKYPTTNPVTGRPLTPTPFYNKSLNFGSTPAGQPLPHLDLNRVFVLTGGGTCSASESIINGLRGANVEVIQIGSATCGKPYGFYPKDNCGTTYFTIQIQGVNDKGFGDYADGFTPGTGGPADPRGCNVADDFTHELGDPNESRLAAALSYASNGTCPAAPMAVAQWEAVRTSAAAEGELVRSPWRENRILGR